MLQETRELSAYPATVTAAGRKRRSSKVANGQFPRSALALHRRVATAMLLTDASAVLVAFSLAQVARFGTLRFSPVTMATMAFATAAWIVIFSAYQLYGVLRFGPAEEFRRVFSAASASMAAIVVMSFLLKSGVSRELVMMAWVFSLILTVGARKLWHSWMGRARAARTLALRTAVIGNNDEAVRITSALKENLGIHGLDPIGYVATGGPPASMNGLPVLGDLDALPWIVSVHGIECLYLASTALTDQQAKLVTRSAAATGLEVRVSANIYDILSSRIAVQPVGDLLALNLRPVRLTLVQAAAKRLFDLSFALLVALLAAPLLILVAVAVKVESSGPVFFTQERVTANGRRFRMYKFRTMVRDGDKLLMVRGIDPTVPYFKMKDDPRVTRIGRVLRALSLDEVPQLLNVIKGDMSLVGPRPLAAYQVDVEPELLGPRHRMKTGITGWWQILGRGSVSGEEAVRMDLFYVENWSLALDLYIVLKTIKAVVARRGAY